MKSKILIILVIIGVVCLAVASAVLTRKLFQMQIQPSKSLKIDQPAAAVPQALANTTTDTDTTGSAVKKSGKTAKPVQVSQYTTGQEHNSTPSVNVAEETTGPSSSTTVKGAEANTLLPDSTADTSAQTPVQIPETASTSVVGKVIYLSGSATIAGSDGKTRLLRLNSEVCKMDKIETGPHSKVEIKFGDGTILSPGEKSSIVIEECIYTPANPAGCSFVMRFTKGVCRVLTGLSAHLNPNRFKVKAKMATIGIRGCDLVFKSTSPKDSIYVLDVGQAKSIEVDTTKNGTAVNDIQTGKELDIADSIKRHISITEPQTAVTVTDGQGPEQHSFEMGESRNLMTETSRLTPARYQLQQKANGATLRISPAAPRTTAPSEE